MRKLKLFLRLAGCLKPITLFRGGVMIYAQHFSAEEFHGWAEDISPRLVTMLDVLRFRFGRPIAISASDYAYGS